jgi:hypothetical protein
MVDGLTGGNAKPDLSVGANSPPHELKRSSDWSENARAACRFSLIGQSEAISLLVTINALAFFDSCVFENFEYSQHLGF